MRKVARDSVAVSRRGAAVYPKRLAVIPDPVITLTTDFGEDSPYVAAMKGVLIGINPCARLVDLSHQIRPRDVRHTAFFLSAAIPCFPRGVIHVVVVDPGVGSDRALLYVEVNGHRLLAPDNGCWTELAHGSSRLPAVHRLAEPRYWRHPVSATFHGRDILAPVAAHLSMGVEPRLLGPAITEWVRLELPRPRQEPNRLSGEVVFVDHFGNLITNIPGEVFTAWTMRPLRITVEDQEVTQQVRTYAEAASGTLVALVSSSGMLEIAICQGSAAEKLQGRIGTAVVVSSER